MKTLSNKILLITTIGVLSAALLLAGKFGDSKPYQEWSQREALSLLRDSAWSQTQLVKMAVLGAGAATPRTRTPEGSGAGGLSGEGSGTYGGTTSEPLTRTTAAFNASFISAKPVRMALARLGMLKGSLDAQAADQLVENTPFSDQIAISLAVESAVEMIDLEALTTADLQDSSFLELKKSKRRIAVQEYVPPSRSGNGQPIFIFPRNEAGRPLVTLDEKEVRFIARFSDELKVDQKFKLKKMVFNGELEI